MSPAPCVHRSVNSPEPLRPALAFAIAALLTLGSACSRSARSVRLPALSPGDEIYRISCNDAIQACRDEATKVCGGPYEVLEATGAPITPPRVTTAPGPASTGPRYQRAKWVGQWVVACVPATANGSGPEPLPSAGAANEASGSAARPAGERLCIPGVTQECLGPGACRGAQACLADGNGYGACDCGNGNGNPRSAPSNGLPAAGDAPPSRSHR